MPIFYAHQNKSYKREKAGGLVWSPQRTKGGRRNAGYENMTKLHAGDYILHHFRGKIVALGRVLRDCEDAPRPQGLSSVWNSDGYVARVEYHELDTPLAVKDYRTRLQDLPNDGDGNAFNKNGGSTETYMCVLTNEQATFLLNNLLYTQKQSIIQEEIRKALLVIMEDEDQIEDTNSIDSAIESGSLPSEPTREGLPKTQELVTSSTTGRLVPKRDQSVAIKALCIANHRCEYDNSHQTFFRKGTNIQFMESHHLIPLSRFRDFNFSLDVDDNVVSLCPQCHRLLHHANIDEKKPLLEKLYNDRIDGLRRCKIELSLDQLMGYYR